jgi:archaellum biogenesis ATPase FlaH
MLAELVIDDFKRRGRIVDERLLVSPRFLKEHYQRAVWRSFYSFGEDAATYAETHGTMDSGYAGEYHAELLRLDFDAGRGKGIDELPTVLAEVRHMIRHLHEDLDVPLTWIQPWFSGKKGFHLAIPELFGIPASPQFPAILRASVRELLGHPMLDMQPMLEAGLIRLEWTRHEDTGLYKVPLSMEEFFKLSAEEIVRIAENPAETRKGFRLAEMDDVEPIWNRLVVHTPSKLRYGHTRKGVSLAHSPNRVVTCMQKLVAAGAQPGRRHQDLLRVASWLYRMGVPANMAVPYLTDWAVKAGPSKEGEHVNPDSYARIVEGVYERGYIYSCRDSVMREFCDTSCLFHPNKDYTMEVSDARTMGQGYREFLQKVYRKGVGFDFRDLYPNQLRNRSYRVLPGDVIMVTGDTGMGKSALVQNWLDQIGQRALYLNLEMAENLVFRRMIQIHHGLTKQEIEHAFLRGTEEQREELEAGIAHIECVSVAPNVHMMEHMIIQRDPSIVVIDTTDAVEVPEAGNNELFQLKRIVEEMRKLAQRHQKIVIGIHHITKQASRDRLIDLNSLTGHRSNVTKMDHVFAVDGDRDGALRYLHTLKARDDSPLEIKLVFDWQTLRFEEQTAGNPLA